jgi:N6-L-threonylcarbamoyladenine synthase
MKHTRIFAIETSCDETAISIVDFFDGFYTVKAHLVESQNESHAPFGGVVPEVASRDHLSKILGLAQQALHNANCEIGSCSHIAVTMGPGLIGPIMVGVLFARGLATSTQIPLIAVNHVDAHLAPCFFGTEFNPKTQLGVPLRIEPLALPCLALTISGGHCHLSHLTDASQRTLLGSTLDDACGESFDKVAKLLGLRYPGGPMIEVLAAQGKLRPEWKFPQTLSDPMKPLDFSFSGLKTAVLERVRKELGNPKGKIDGSTLSAELKADIAFNFQEAALFQLCDRFKNAILHCQKNNFAAPKCLLVAGGVAANSRFRQLAKTFELPVRFAPMSLCGDNATMIALQAQLCKIPEGDSQPFSRYKLNS